MLKPIIAALKLLIPNPAFESGQRRERPRKSNLAAWSDARRVRVEAA